MSVSCLTLQVEGFSPSMNDEPYSKPVTASKWEATVVNLVATPLPQAISTNSVSD